MKGDFSRLRFNPKNNYTSVLQQQGRVSLDSDANEQSFIDDYLRSTGLTDIVGPYGGPRGDCGFKITFKDGTLTIGAGRYYVNGLLCENTVDNLHYEDQPFLIAPTVTTADLYTRLRSGEYVGVHVFLEVWQRLVTVLDDTSLREPAIGQADTTARLQTVWRVIAEPIQNYDVQATALTTELQPILAQDIATDLRIDDTPQLDTALESDLKTNLTAQLPTLRPAAVGCCEQMYSDATLQPVPGTMFAQTTPASGDCTCEPTPAAGYRGLENQLYRVEIHTPGNASKATFKWSRENGSVVVAVVSTSAAVVTVASLGPDSNLGFSKGDWVELTDDTHLFGSIPNKPGQLCQIAGIDRGALTVTMTADVDTLGANARMRRWDQGGASDTGLPLNLGAFTTLENGIEVQFKDGEFLSGDYWLIPARSATGNIEWPSAGSADDYQPPTGWGIMLAPLACIAPPVEQADRGGVDGRTIGDIEVFPVNDCRRCFYPLTRLTPDKPKAIHVTGKSWTHDDIMTADVLIDKGLTVTVDQTLTSPVTSGNFIVTFEWAAPPVVAIADTALAVAPLPAWTVLRTSLIVETIGFIQQTAVAATAAAGASTQLLWQLPNIPINLGQDQVLLYLGALIGYGAPLLRFCRVRIRMMGSNIFSGSTSADRLYLDGRCFTEPGTDVLNLPRLELILPSGDGEKASDFESWFYLAPVLAIVSMEPNYPAATVIVDDKDNVTALYENFLNGIKAVITLNYPAVKETTISLRTEPGGIESEVQIPNSVTTVVGSITVDVPITIAFNPGRKDGDPIRKEFLLIATMQPEGNLPPSYGHCKFTAIGA